MFRLFSTKLIINLFVLSITFYSCNNTSNNIKISPPNKPNLSIKIVSANQFISIDDSIYLFEKKDSLARIKMLFDGDLYDFTNRYVDRYEFGFNEFSIENIYHLNHKNNDYSIKIKHAFGGGSSSLYYVFAKINLSNLPTNKLYSFRNHFEILELNESKMIFIGTLSESDIDVELSKFTWDFKSDSITIEPLPQ
jgi:hypothetical protein